MRIEINATIKKPVQKVWECWTKPEHIVHWNFATDDWECPKAQNNLQVGGTFNYKMAAKDGTMGFNFTGTYTKVVEHKRIEYELDDERKVIVEFVLKNNETTIIESFDSEDEHSTKQQKEGWQNILNNFKKYVESGK